MFSIDKIIRLSASSKLFWGSSRKARIISSSALFLAACAVGAAGVAPMAPDAANLPVKSISEQLSLPQLSEQIAALTQGEQSYISEERIRPGDTLAMLLSRLGVDDTAATNFIKTDRTARSLLQLKPGRLVQARTSDNGELVWLTATASDGRDAPVRTLTIKREGDRFNAAESQAQLERRIEMRAGDIRSSLFAATDTAQLPDNVASQLVDMFSTDIDFASDLRRGDRFNVVYETFWQNGEYVRAGRILAAEFVNAGKTFQAVWFDEPGSKQSGGYYSFDGKSLKKAFLKSPLEYTRISSGFAMRLHPILGQWKQHKGVDFAAPSGTPIRAAADGTIEFAGRQGGYGNLIVIKHWGTYSTAYGHMSRFASGMRKGLKISQGEIIGYVGSTGWATGPHLHYEFRIDNQPRDPLKVDIPNALPLAGADLQRFRSVAEDMSHRIALLNPNLNGTKLASK
jgi:murein DD-endopeptidase MepM/ murein hydrolase activator NlpD